MKKIAMLILCIGLIVSMSTAVFANDMGVQIIGTDAGSAGSGDLIVGEKIQIEKVCDVTLLGYVADTYAMSIAAYERDAEETIVTPEAEAVADGKYYGGSSWGTYERYKLKDNKDGKDGYYYMYVNIGTALEASSDDYMLVDIRLNLLNRAITPFEINDRIKASLKYADEYDFELTTIKTETSDTLGNKNEWLSDDLSIPVLVDRNVHLIFEVPNIVATDTESLVATITIADNEYEVVLR